MFYTDKPISSNKQDLLKRDGFAKLLAQSLINLKSNDTFTVGLFGEWGSGKTSLVNMMLSEIELLQSGFDEKDRLIVVHFEPWNFSNGDQLLTQFFIRLSNEFRSKKDDNLAKIGDALENYSEAFDIAETIPIVGGLLALLGKKGSSALGKKMKKGADEKDILKQKEYVIKLLEQQSNKILIVIDDIDRLSNQQIRQVFQLITSVAKFPNTTYLLVFDKKIVVKALEQVQEGKGEDYLEKIIQMPIQIPNIQKKELHQVLFNRLDSMLSEYKNILFSNTHWQKLFQVCVAPFIKNLRDVNRLCNSIQFKLAALSEEVNFVDLVSISVLEIYLPSIYEWVKENKALLTGEFDISSIGFQNRSQSDWYKFYQGELKRILQNDKFTSEETVETTITFLVHLFPHFGHKLGKTYETYDQNLFRKNNQIAHPDKFDRYFHLNLDNITLKRTEILHMIQVADENELALFMLKQDKEGNAYEFLEEINAMVSEISADRIRCIVKTLIKISNFFNSISSKHWFGLSSNNFAEFLIVDLIEKLLVDERFTFICDVINTSDLNALETCADIINRIELGYGRLAANGEEQNYKKLITLDEVGELEKVFCARAKLLLERKSLFSVDSWRRISYLLECFEPEYMKAYLTEELKDDENRLKYLVASITTWTGSGVKYEIQEDYKKYLTDEDILGAIESLRKKGSLFTLSDKVQNSCGAFYLKSIGKLGYDGDIFQVDVDELLNSWKVEIESI